MNTWWEFHGWIEQKDKEVFYSLADGITGTYIGSLLPIEKWMSDWTLKEDSERNLERQAPEMPWTRSGEFMTENGIVTRLGL